MSLEDNLYPLLSLYDRLPQGVRNFVGAAYRRLPRRIRYGKAYGEFRELADDADARAAGLFAHELRRARHGERS